MVDLLNRRVRHTGVLGVGIVTKQEEKYITVEFANKISKFMYPSAFEKFLVPEESDILDVINAEIAVLKAAEETKKAEEAAEMANHQATKEQARLVGLSNISGRKTGSSKVYMPMQRTLGQTLTYLVFQGNTFDEECKGQFIWAPKYTKGGGTCHHWDRLMDIREGDVIFHCSDGYIQAISRAKGSYQECARPAFTIGGADWNQWEKDGRKVDCDYHVLKIPLKHGDYKEIILPYCKVKYAPFDKRGNGNVRKMWTLWLNRIFP